MDFLIGVLLMALSVAFLGTWGIIKKQRKGEELYRKLMIKGKQKIVKEYRNKDSLSEMQIENILQGTTASLFWSKEKIKITNTKVFAKDLIKKMMAEGSLEEKKSGGKVIYVCK